MLSNDAPLYMQLALENAARGLYTTTPNPRVGCVLVKAGQIIGQGYTQPAGHNHAEIQAIQHARAQGHDPRGATAYVTLEPCSHIGRTPACSQALIDAGIASVVAAMEDPNPLVQGQGLAMLRCAGLFVHCGLLEEQARELNLGFISRMTLQRPWVRLKIAASLDGKTALPHGESQWITGSAARADGHAWRARACALLTGIGTVKQDDPQFTVREVATPRQPQKIVIDPRLEIPLTARLLRQEPNALTNILIVCGSPALFDTPKAHALHRAGVEMIAYQNTASVRKSASNQLHRNKEIEERASEDPIPCEWVSFDAHSNTSNANTLLQPNNQPVSRISLPSLLKELAARGINELHVEAGARLHGAFWQAGCVDELLLYIAPTILHEGRGLFDLPGLPTLPSRPHLVFHNVTSLGPDLRIIARMVDTLEKI